MLKEKKVSLRLYNEGLRNFTSTSSEPAYHEIIKKQMRLKEILRKRFKYRVKEKISKN